MVVSKSYLVFKKHCLLTYYFHNRILATFFLCWFFLFNDLLKVSIYIILHLEIIALQLISSSFLSSSIIISCSSIGSLCLINLRISRLLNCFVGTSILIWKSIHILIMIWNLWSYNNTVKEIRSDSIFLINNSVNKSDHLLLYYLQGSVIF